MMFHKALVHKVPTNNIEQRARPITEAPKTWDRARHGLLGVIYHFREGCVEVSYVRPCTLRAPGLWCPSRTLIAGTHSYVVGTVVSNMQQSSGIGPIIAWVGGKEVN